MRKIAKKYGCSLKTVQNIKERLNIKSYKKKKVPKRTEEQAERAKLRSGRLYRFLQKQTNRCILMDDETYVYLDSQLLLHTQYFMASPGEKLKREETVLPTGKFEKKVLVWQAICLCGRKSTPFFTFGTINTDVYIKDCIKGRLLRLARSHETPPLFWPDLASSHYAKRTLDILEESGLETVPKELNPPNCPELRPIEKFWAICKRHVFETRKEAKDLPAFKRIWNNSAKKVTQQVVQTLMEGVLRKVRAFYRE